MKRSKLTLLTSLVITVFAAQSAMAQQPIPRQLKATRTDASIKIDGKIDEAAWKSTTPATDMVELRPNFGAKEDPQCRTEIYFLYDNTSVYIAGYCHERIKDSVSKELVGRDEVGINDFVGIIFDTYHDKINGVGFYVTPLGEQFDAKYSNSNNGEDPSWNAVWDSEAKIVADGWTFEMRIPYSALRFVSKDDQTWGMNITRNRKKVGRQYTWNPVDPKVNGFINQEGEWIGIQKIEAPVRLSFSPYLSTYVNHYNDKDVSTKDWTSSVNGGMDVKYGINDAFTLDMTLIPDFGQVQSDNRVLNLSPFEIKYTENRPFFTEGTELFSKGDLFYSRRVGSTPLHFGDVYSQLEANETVTKNPVESKLINATKISGRTKKGLGIGLFNAITKPMYATIENLSSKETRKYETGPLSNYNIVVLDQTLKNNSAISFINTNTLRSGADYDANVSAALFNFNNKKNTYNWTGKFAVSQIMAGKQNTVGYSHQVGFGKSGGRWNFQLTEDIADSKYDINDMGILFNNNYIDHYFWTGYRWLKPTNWYNRINLNFNAYYSMLYTKIPGQKVNTSFQIFRTNINSNIQLKNLWSIGMFVGYIPEGNDFYEPRTQGYSFRSPRRIQINPSLETNETKKYFVAFNYFLGLRSLFNSPNHEVNFTHRYRFNDKLSIRQDITYNPAINDAGFYRPTDANGNPYVTDDILFSRRDHKTVENIFSVKYSFNNKSFITIRTRHYWSKVTVKQVYDLQTDGTLQPTSHAGVPLQHQNLNLFNVDAVYTLQFAPGSFINIVWKDQSDMFDRDVHYTYFKNLDRNLSIPQNSNLSFKIIYFLDYLNVRKWKSKK